MVEKPDRYGKITSSGLSIIVGNETVQNSPGSNASAGFMAVRCRLTLSNTD
jgi:hypothetical protein